MTLHVTSDNLASLMRHPAAQHALAAVARNAELTARNSAPGSTSSIEDAAYAQGVADVLACLTGVDPADELCWTLGVSDPVHD